MSSVTEKTMFGAVIEPRPTPPLATATPTKPASFFASDAPPTPLSTVSTQGQEPGNPFADHFQKTGDATKNPTDVYVHDIESQRHLGLARTLSSADKENSMWPTKKAQKAKAKQQKCAKSWNPMAAWGKKQKMIASAVIALCIIGLAVGLGVGVSKAVGGGVNTMHGTTKPIGTDEGKRN